MPNRRGWRGKAESSQAALSIKRKFGKNALVKGMDLQEDATAMTRNNQIGGHKA